MTDDMDFELEVDPDQVTAEAPAIIAEDRTPAPVVAPCPRCGREVAVRSRHVLVQAGRVRVFCSAECLEAAALGLPVATDPAPAPARRRRWLRASSVAVGLGVAGVLLTPHEKHRPAPTRSPLTAASIIPQKPAPPPPPQSYGPPWPPTDADVMAEIAQDAWFHPLAGPVRRMPISDGRVFGAERPGERPAECRSGHCGVDIGGEVWGEHVLAAHDGIVDRVVRGPNEEHGGLYVRIAHRGGTVFTQYFHLAAIPRRLVPGMPVKAGEVIGLLGDTGVKESRPHLHFTVSVKPSKELPERYIDPEPLIALWPLLKDDGKVAGLMADARPGLPRGAGGRVKRATQQARARTKPAEPEAPAPEAADTPAAD